jgi:hypothetical protein
MSNSDGGQGNNLVAPTMQAGKLGVEGHKFVGFNRAIRIECATAFLIEQDRGMLAC